MLASFSALRLAGLIAGILGLTFLAARRRHRLLGRLELILFIGLAGMAVVAAVPGIANILPMLTGFTGELSRITSLMAFAIVGLVAMVALLQAQVGELRHKFHLYLRNAAVKDALASVEGTADLAIIMPAFNEAENLPAVLDAAPTEVRGLSTKVIVVDDGSSDDTAEVAAAHGAWVVTNPVNAGGGHALQVGFLAAQRLGCRYTVTMDADGQHRFEDLDTVVDALLNHGGEVVVGSRHLGLAVQHETVRAVGLVVFNWIISFLVGRRITDCSSGFRGFDMRRFDRLNLIQQRHHTAEMIIEASRRGLTILEVPITILPRVHGESKKGTNWLYGLRFANTIMSSWWRR